MKANAWIVKKREINPDLAKLVLGYLSFKVGLVLVVAFASEILPIDWQLATANGWYPLSGIPRWFAGFANWDASNYIQIANHGYGSDVMKRPFYPLYPLAIRFFKPLFFGNSLLSAFVISNVCSIFVVIYLYRLARTFLPNWIAYRSVVLFLAFPTSFFLSSAYPESLFLTLTLVAFYYFYKENMWAASIASFLVPLCRPQGLMFVVPLVVLGSQKIYMESRGIRPFLGGNRWRFALPAASAAIGTIAYLLFAKVAFGSPFASFEAEKYYSSDNSLSHLLHPVSWFMKNFVDIHFKLHDYTHGILDRIAFVFAVIALIWIVRTQPLALKVYASLFILVPGLSGNLMAYTRTVLMAFPIFILLGTKRKAMFLVPIMVALQVLFVIMYVSLFWVA